MKRWRLILVTVVALQFLVGVAGLPPLRSPAAPIHSHVGAYYLANAVEDTGAHNVVTAVLLNYRSFDTFFEVVVIFTALAAVLALPRVAAQGVGPDGGTGREAEDPFAAGVPVSVVVRHVVRMLAPFVAMFVLALVFRGHVTPGGGFQAAAVLAALFISLSMVLGQARAARLVPTRAQAWLQGIAPVGFAIAALIGWWLTGAFLGVPVGPDAYLAQQLMSFLLEVVIALGGGVILARLFLLMEA